MVSDRMAAVLSLLDGDRARGASPSSAAARAAVVLEVDGICAGLGTGASGMVLAWGDEAVSAELEDLQFTLGQGPGPDAAAGGAAVLVPDLAVTGARWPQFAPAAAVLGVCAVFALPLRIGAIGVGVLVAHRVTPGPLADGGFADAVALAEAVTLLLIHQQSAAADPGGRTQTGPQQGRTGPETYRAQVHQATGMISAQLGVSLAEALVRLRAHAYAGDRLIAEVAAEVVARRLYFGESDD